MNYLGESALTTINLDNITGDLIPSQDNTYVIGIPTKRWKEIWTPAIHGLSDPVIGSDAANKNYVDRLTGFATWTNQTDGYVAGSPSFTLPNSTASTPLGFLYTPTNTANSYQIISNPYYMFISCIAGNFMGVTISKPGSYRFTLITQIVGYNPSVPCLATFNLYQNGVSLPACYSVPVLLPNASSALPQSFTFDCVVQKTTTTPDIYQYYFTVKNVVPPGIGQTINVGHGAFSLMVQQL